MGRKGAIRDDHFGASDAESKFRVEDLRVRPSHKLLKRGAPFSAHVPGSFQPPDPGEGGRCDGLSP